MAQTFDQGVSDVIANSPNLRDQLGQGADFSQLSQATRQLIAEGAATQTGTRGTYQNDPNVQSFIATGRTAPRNQITTPDNIGPNATTGAPTNTPATPNAPGLTPPVAGSDLTSQIEARYGPLLNQGLTEQQIQEQEMAAVQAQIDAINQIYAGKIQAEEKQGFNRLGRGRSLEALGGTAWSPMGEAQTQAIERQNQQVMDQINAEKQQEIANIYAAARGEATRRVEKQSEQLAANTNAYIDAMVQSYGLSQQEAESLRTDAARIAALTGYYNGSATLDKQNQDYAQNADLRDFLAQQEQIAAQNAQTNRELDMKAEQIRQAGYQVATMDDGTVGYWDYSTGVPKFTAIGNYSRLTSRGGGGGAGYGAGAVGADVANEAINAYFDTFGEFPKASDEANVIARYIASQNVVPTDGSYGPVQPTDPFASGRAAQIQYKSTGTSSGIANPFASGRAAQIQYKSTGTSSGIANPFE